MKKILFFLILVTSVSCSKLPKNPDEFMCSFSLGIPFESIDDYYNLDRAITIGNLTKYDFPNSSWRYYDDNIIYGTFHITQNGDFLVKSEATITLDNAYKSGKLMKYRIELKDLNLDFALSYLTNIYGKAIDSVQYLGNQMYALKTNPPLEIIAKKYMWETDKMSIVLFSSIHSKEFEYIDSGIIKTSKPLIVYTHKDYKIVSDSSLKNILESQTPFDIVSIEVKASTSNLDDELMSSNKKIEVTLKSFYAKDILKRDVKCLFGSYCFSDYDYNPICEFKNQLILNPSEKEGETIYSIDNIDNLSLNIKNSFDQSSFFNVEFNVDSVEFSDGTKVRKSANQ